MLRRVEGSRRDFRERREKVLMEVVGHCLVKANLGAKNGGAGRPDCRWLSLGELACRGSRVVYSTGGNDFS